MGNIDGYLNDIDMKRFISRFICILIAGVLASTVAANAQIAQYKLELEPFTSVTVGNSFKVNLVKGESYSVEVTVNEVLKDFVQVAVSEGVLNVYFEEKKVSSEIMKPFRGRNASAPVFNAVVTVPAGVKNLSLKDEVVLLGFDDVADTAAFNLDMAGNVSVKSAQISSNTVTVNSSRKAGGQLKVIADKLSLTAKGSADLIVDQEVKDVEYNISTNVNLLVNGKSETLKLISAGTSKVIINGETEFARYQLSGSSVVNALNLKAKEANVEMNSICALQQAASEWIFINVSNGATLTYAGEPQIHINSIRNASVVRYQEAGK